VGIGKCGVLPLVSSHRLQCTTSSPRCQYRGGFIALLHTEKNNILIEKSSLRRWQKRFSICPYRHCRQLYEVKKRLQTELCAPLLAIGILIVNIYTRDFRIFKELSQDGGRADFSTNLRAPLFKKCLSNEPNFGQIHLAGQYL
jgi:hypothetical protein